MEQVLKLANVDVRRGGKSILEDVNWQVQPGQHWVILGPNGAGKTTLVKLLTGRIFPSYTDGKPAQASVVGNCLGRVETAQLRTVVGMASSGEDEYFAGDQTATDVLVSVLYGKSVRGREEYEQMDLERASDLLNIFGVAHLADRPMSTLSQGERQRVLIARALMTDPQLLILDEPTAGLDMGARELLLGALEEIIRDPHCPALVLVTHHVEEIPRGITHALLLCQGEVYRAGAIEEVLVDEAVSDVFGLDLQVGCDQGRWWARGK